MSSRSFLGSLFTLAGAIAISTGVYLPWLRTNPDLPPMAPIPSIYIHGMDAGIEVLDFVLLGLVVAGLALHRVSSHDLLEPAFSFLAGILIVLFCAHYLSDYSFTGFDATFVPDIGWYLTVIGGALLAAAGGVQLVRVFESRRSETVQ